MARPAGRLLIALVVILAACDSRPARDSGPSRDSDPPVAAFPGDSLPRDSIASVGEGLSPDELLRSARPVSAEEARVRGLEPDTSIHLEHPVGWDTLR